jgi:RimJ/RimL family protein N-acetyltransferase
LALVDDDIQTSRHGLTLVFDRDDEVAAWVASKLPIRFTAEQFGPCATIGMADKNGKLVAGCVYHRWRGFDCEVTFASVTPRWVLPQNLTPLFHYPFVQRACTRITLIIGANNNNAIKTNVRIGFKIEGVHPRAYDGINDAVSLGMLRHECRWIKQ